MFDSLFSTTDTVTTAISLTPFVVSVATALALGLVVALCYCFKSRYNKGFVTTLAMLPFRSVAGSARDIGFIFLSMAIGLVCGMGYVGYAALITAILCGGFFVYQLVGFGSGSEATDRTVRITVPEDLDYTSLFDDLFARYTTYCELVSVKTVNMGSLYRLVYNVGMKDATAERAFLDDLRCRNGNMEISISRQETIAEQL